MVAGREEGKTNWESRQREVRSHCFFAACRSIFAGSESCFPCRELEP